MYYDCPEDDEFYTESEYQEKIDALKEAIRSSVKSEIQEEVNRLRAENEKLQGIKEHFEELKNDYERKKSECDRAIRNAEYNAKTARLAELMKDHKVIKWKIEWEHVYGPKCSKCDSSRMVRIKLPSGNTVSDACECRTESKRYHYPKMYVLYEFSDGFRSGEIIAHYLEKKSGNGTYYGLHDITVCDKFTPEEKKKAVETLSDNVTDILFDQEEECQKVCDQLNESIGNFLYKRNGESITEYLKIAKGE